MGSPSKTLHLVWSDAPDLSPTTDQITALADLATKGRQLFTAQQPKNDLELAIAAELQRQLPTVGDTTATRNAADQVAAASRVLSWGHANDPKPATNCPS